MRGTLLAILLLDVAMAGCSTAPTDTATSATGSDLRIHALYANDCPPGSTCAPIGGGAGNAEVLLDGQRWNVTDDFGWSTLHHVSAGTHHVCVQHSAYGAAERDVMAPDDGELRFVLFKSAPTCPEGEP